MTNDHPTRRPRRPPQAVYADYDDSTIAVYQAYPPAIAEAAVAAGTFRPPFKLDRMTWIKPSYTWMAYRSGYATKENQTRVLRVRMHRSGFEWALNNACPSHFDSSVHTSREEWNAALGSTPVRVQWDPERDLHHAPLAHRSVQVGLGGVAVRRYLAEWITEIADVTPHMHRVRDLVCEGDLAGATALLPVERHYVLPADATARTGATPRPA